MTAIGGYIAVVVVDMITSDKVITDPVDQLAWPVSTATRIMTGPADSQKK